MSIYDLPGQLDFHSLTLYDRLLQQRLIFLNQILDDAIANQIIAAMLYLDAEDTDQDIRLCINASGHSDKNTVLAAIAIYDTMACIQADVSTICTGVANAAGTLLLIVGASGKRLALPHARIQLTQTTQILTGSPTTHISIEAKELLYLRQTVNKIIADKTGQPIQKIAKDSERGLFMSAQEAQAYGLIDQVVSH